MSIIYTTHFKGRGTYLYPNTDGPRSKCKLTHPIMEALLKLCFLSEIRIAILGKMVPTHASTCTLPGQTLP